jgi:hypothetical protein
MISTISNVPRVLYKKDFKQYFPQSVKTPLGPHMAQLVRNSRTFNETKARIEEMTSACYLEGQVKITIMDDFKVGTAVCLSQLFACLNCLPVSTVCPQLFAPNCLPSTVCPQLTLEALAPRL